MKETADIGAAPAVLALARDAVLGFSRTRAAVSARSGIVWGEHCTECAFPDCYSSCSFYTPRADLHCRRFENGIERLDEPGLGLTRIAFRRWGKLEGQGELGLKPARLMDVAEGLDRAADALLGAPMPAGLRESLSWRLNRTKRMAGGLGKPVGPDDVFLLEAWLEPGETWPFTLSVMATDKASPGLFQSGLALTPGYNRVVIPAGKIAALVDLTGAVQVQLEPLRDGCPPIVFGLIDFVRLSETLANAPASPAATAGNLPKFKCVVWDLDNTLWRGVLVEDGIEGVVPSPAAVDLVRELDRRGIINSIASKNDPGLAFAALERFGLRDYFVFPKIGWGPKSEAIAAIVAEMDVGADTFAFIDDQAFERGEIGQLLPLVTVFADTELDRLLTDPRFDVPVTAESAMRRRMYQTEERRVVALAEAGDNYVAFLRSCAIVLEVRRLNPANMTRVYELSQRTNQLNFSGIRYSMADLERLGNTRPQDTFVLSCSDKFGDYGAIGFCALGAGQGRIESFFMSCRVQRKRVENAFFQMLADELYRRGARKFEVQYCPTAKNAASAQMLEDLGFEFQDGAAADGLYVADLPRRFGDHDVVHLALDLAATSERALA